MRRRDSIKVIGGAVISWPRSVRAQQADRMRRIGVLMNLAENDPLGQTRLAAFLQAMEKLGWSVGRNVRIDARWGAGEVSLYRKYATELVALAPDVLFAPNTSVTRALLEVSRTVPIVFAVPQIRLLEDWLKAWLGRAATSLDSPNANLP